MKTARKPMLLRMAAMTMVATLAWAGQAAAQPTPPVPPLPPASGASAPDASELICERRPQVCEALHRANQALLDAAEANHKGQYICTSLNHPPACSTTPPKAYVTPRGNSPYGNPGDVAEGRRLLDWYFKNLTCEALCKSKQDPRACKITCSRGGDISGLPEAGDSTGKPSKPKP
ncbi:hypothetical protein ACS5PN_02095 [Roseateles sp. NT4]|uniref:hypothetical protein n=1 Tax=Roseateles sp. NT4 TaxID=3453715 RepID=UPI003EEA2A62